MYEFVGRGSVFSPPDVKHISGMIGFVFCPTLAATEMEFPSAMEMPWAISLSGLKNKGII